MNDSGDSVMWLNKKQLNKNKKPQQHTLKMVRFKDETENEWQSSQCPKKHFIDLQKTQRTIVQDHFKKCTVLYNRNG